MTKPTKTKVRPASPDTSAINRSAAGNGSLKNTQGSDIFAPGTKQLPDTSTAGTSGSEMAGAPRVVVSYITDPLLTETNARLAEISLPILQAALLQPHKSVDGLFVAPGGQIYAHLEDGRHYRVELNTAGHYQIPWPAAPGVTPPILKKSTASHVGASRHSGTRLTPDRGVCLRSHGLPNHYKRSSSSTRTWRPFCLPRGSPWTVFAKGRVGKPMSISPKEPSWFAGTNKANTNWLQQQRSMCRI
ncbi:hypothetical protein [Pseudomonas sp. S2_E02]